MNCFHPVKWTSKLKKNMLIQQQRRYNNYSGVPAAGNFFLKNIA